MYDGNYVSPTEAFAEMQKSTFCLVPRGDTPSSRRFFSAIAAGCIPVLITDDYEPPFQHALLRVRRMQKQEVHKKADLLEL